MKVLVIGGGGREHALAWKAAQCEAVRTVYAAPGNAGTERESKIENVDISAEDVDGLVAFARDAGVGLTIVGPEAPLVAGLADRFEAQGLRVFGPRRLAAQLEASKSFTKAFLSRHRIPTAAYETFDALAPALDYIEARGAPIVIKADGLAAGKGVTIAGDVEQAKRAAAEMLEGGVFGEAGRRIVVEEYLQGEEASFIAVVGGGEILPLASSQDHKAAGDGDTGPNTGGMGAYSPAPVIDALTHRRVLGEVIEPTVQGLAEEDRPYTGFLYAGLMIDADGTPRVLEYNCRCGDPETQPIMMRLQTDLVELCDAAIAGRLSGIEAQWDARVALGVVMASQGYPASYPKGDAIAGLDDDIAHTKVFHAATRVHGDQVVSAGGRVLCVCGLGDTVHEAQTRAYQRVRGISWAHAYYRTDIGYRAVAREERLTQP